MRHVTVLGLALMATACIDPESDEDEDGLTAAEEWELGTNPSNPDSDGDFRYDALDFDPLDPAIAYEGGWPTQSFEFKDAAEADGGTGKVIKVGKRFPRLVLKDHHGEPVDLYDFSGHGKKIVIDISAEWCPPCIQLAQLLEEESVGDPSFDPVLAAIRSGDIYWLTVMSEDNQYEAPKVRVAKDWAKAYPNEHIPVLADRDQELLDYVIMTTNSWPTLVLLNQNMKVVEVANGVDPEFFAALSADL